MIIAVTMVRDEADVLPWTLPHMAAQVDHVIVADNRSTDGCVARALLGMGALADRVTVVHDPEVGYYQDQKMTRLAHAAGDMGASWVVPFDADEAWYHVANLETWHDADVALARPNVFVPHDSDDDDDPNPISRMLWRTPHPEPHPKVAFRYHADALVHMGNHGVSFGAGVPTANWGPCGVRHYQFRSLRQLRRKITNGMEAYDAAPERSSSGSYWRDLAAMDRDGTLDAWWETYLNQPLVHDPDY